MIRLFNIPTHTVDTSKFSNLLHDKIVTEFEETIANYVGANYAVAVNSATSAIFLILKFYERFVKLEDRIVSIPSIIPPVVCNAILTAGWKIEFNDYTEWVGSEYFMRVNINGTHRFICDSAQKLEEKQWKELKTKVDFMFFSFYPTKPVSSCDGGMIVSDNKEYIRRIRRLSFNGMLYAENNWNRAQITIGYKMYMNSVSAYIANENFKNYSEKLDRLFDIREKYNKELKTKNKSNHLFRILLMSNSKSMKHATEAGIQCGVHYDAAHMNPLFSPPIELHNSWVASETMLSIPFHEMLKKQEIEKIIEFCKTQMIR